MILAMLDDSITALGFDFGMRYIGVAIGQTLTKTARTLTTLKAEKGIPKWDEIAQLIKEWQPQALVVGIPLNMDDTKQFTTDAALEFKKHLQEKFSLPVYEVDERLTTIEAKSHIFAEKGYKGLKKKDIDAMSAKIILEGWLQAFK